MNLLDLPIIHTCKYYRSSPEDKKKMILNELINQASRDKKGISLIDYALQSFGNSNKVSRDSIIKYIFNIAEFGEDVSYFVANGRILSIISLLLAYKIIIKDNEDLDMFIKTI